MSSEAGLLSIATGLVERARAGEDLEAFVTHSRNFEVKAFEGEVESLSSAEPRGAGVRLISGGKPGFAYTTDLSDEGIDTIVDIARSNSQHSTPDEAVGLAQNRFRAKAVKAEVGSDGGRRVYYIRLLSPEGRVWTVSVDAATGKIANQ